MRAAMAARLAEAGGRRPSVELLFHALLPERLVLHTHPIGINAITCNRDGAALAARLFGERVLWVPYTDPGLPLARAIVEARRAHVERTGGPAPAITRHAEPRDHRRRRLGGRDRSSARAGSTRRSWRRWAGTIAAAARPSARWLPRRAGTSRSTPEPAALDAARARMLVDVIGPTLRGLLAAGTALRVVTFDAAPLAATFTADRPGAHFVRGGPLTPDQIVYAGPGRSCWTCPTAIEPDAVPDAAARAACCSTSRRHGAAPIIVVVPAARPVRGGRDVRRRPTPRATSTSTPCASADGALRLGGVRPLADAERTFIEALGGGGLPATGRSRARRAAAGSRARSRSSPAQPRGSGSPSPPTSSPRAAHVVLADLNAALADVERPRPGGAPRPGPGHRPWR